MPAVVPLVVAGATATGVAATIGTAIAGAAIGTAAATAIGAGVIGAGASLATGKNIGESLTAGVVSGLTAGIGSTVGSAIAGAGSAADAVFVAADASQLAAQGLSEAAIAQNLVSAGVSSTAAQTAAQMALSGATEAAIAGSLGSGTLFQAPPAPIETATAVPAEQVAYPGVGVEQTYTPASGSFQEALPGLGVQTQASMAPYTAVPGSFGAATAPAATAAGYGILSPIQSPAFSVQDTLRTARLANQLMNPQQQQQAQQQQQLPQQQASAVDLQGIPRIGVKTPNVAGLLSPITGRTQPVFNPYTGEPSLLPTPNFSLLG
jgi:hypothetical protein